MILIIMIILSAWCVSLQWQIGELKSKVNTIFTGIQKGDDNRKWRGYWKIHPNDREAIANDTRTCEEIAKLYNVSRSYVSQIKRDYKTKK